MSPLYQTIVWLCFLIKNPASLIAKVVENTPDYIFPIKDYKFP